MDPEHRDLMIKTLKLIDHTRHEISQLREEVQSAWDAVGQSQRLLSRVERHRRSLPVSSGHRVQALGSQYTSGRSRTWLKFKNPNAPAVKREAEEDWGKVRWR